VIEAQLQHYMNFTYSEVKELTEDELVNEYAKMKWILKKKSDAMASLKNND
jgi:hypothetical protein